jgi:hypothetical protein
MLLVQLYMISLSIMIMAACIAAMQPFTLTAVKIPSQDRKA